MRAAFGQALVRALIAGSKEVFETVLRLCEVILDSAQTDGFLIEETPLAYGTYTQARRAIVNAT